MSRRARSRGSYSHNAKAGFACKELRRYSPTNVFVPDDDYPPMGQCVPYVPIIHSDAYWPHAIQLYTPPSPSTPSSVPFPSTLPIPAMYFLPFVIPPYQYDSYGPTAVQIYSPYIPPLVKMRSIRDVIGLGQDSDVPMPYHRNEATPFRNHSMLSALPTPPSVDFSTNSLLHFACPVLGLVIIIALGVSTLYCALKKLRQHEPVAADTTEFEEYYSALSSFEEISGLEHLPLQEGDNIPQNDKATRTEQLNEHMASRINGSSVSGAREKIKFAPGRKRLRTELWKETRIKVQSSASMPLLPRKRSLSEMEYPYVFWSHCHYEPSIAGTFPYLYCAVLTYCLGKRGRYDTQDADNFEVEDNISKPFSTDAINIGFEENILGPSSLEELRNIDRKHFKEDENCHHISMDPELFETEPSRTHDCSSSNIVDEVSEDSQHSRFIFKEELGNVEKIPFEQVEECRSISGNEKSFKIEQLIDLWESRTNGCSSTHMLEEPSAEPSEDEHNSIEHKHIEQKEEYDRISENDKSFEIEQLIDHTESRTNGCSSTDMPDEASAGPTKDELNSVEPKQFEQKDECDHISENDKSLEIERLNDHNESRTNDCSSSIMAEYANAEPTEDRSLIDPLNVNNFFAEEQMSAQSSPSDDGDNFEFKEKLSEPSISSSVLTVTVVEPNNLEENEKCRHIAQNDKLNETQISKTKRWDGSTQQQSGSGWYIATGMGNNKKQLLTTRTSKNQLWDSSTQQQSGSRWYIATGMGKNKKDPFTKSKPTAKSSKMSAAPCLTLTTNTMQPGQSLWSVSSRLFGFGAKKSSSTIVEEVNDEPRTAEEVNEQSRLDSEDPFISGMDRSDFCHESSTPLPLTSKGKGDRSFLLI